MQLTSQLDVLRSIYGTKLVAELLEFSHERDASASVRSIQYSVAGFISNANYQCVIAVTMRVAAVCEL